MTKYEEKSDLLEFLGLLVFAIYAIVMSAFVSMKFYEWFVQSVFNTPLFTLNHFVGFSFFLSSIIPTTKINIRKEFFRVSLDELEQIVNELEPTAAFNKTMVATEFRQSLSSDEGYSTDFDLGYVEDDE